METIFVREEKSFVGRLKSNFDRPKLISSGRPIKSLKSTKMKKILILA